jgi:hypothetical protein
MLFTLFGGLQADFVSLEVLNFLRFFDQFALLNDSSLQILFSIVLDGFFCSMVHVRDGSFYYFQLKMYDRISSEGQACEDHF